ncbi:protein translocase subunit SecF [Galbitalea sp. SE-J8]|uniref:protein translocase subunit SecF n=1 Tax=Galbitalea sp. SE-J8 TaxID=3054952 RepID=UPI00259CAC4F|nr:protein translocase subunit SecF [Galbitalea sp. SE-J8]MDM4763240.1 protein translocase subunit SecF [Galbitalea sp. SE-J8]
MASFAKFGNDLYTGARSYDFVGRRTWWYIIAGVLIGLSILLPILRGGFVFGIEFVGGSQFQVNHVTSQSESLATDTVHEIVPDTTVKVTQVGTDGMRVQTEILKSKDVSDQVAAALGTAFHTKDVDASYIGPVWGADITDAAVRALVVFLVIAAVLMGLYFRTWKMSLAAIISLVHDMIITAGVYGALGFEITPSAVIGFLTILGYSLYDTVVVFDKIRENTSEDGPGASRTFGESVNLAVNQTLVRSINTGVVAALPVAAILFIGAAILGAGTLRDIALSLFVGIVIGTYSTIFIGAPVYAHLRQNEPAIKKRTERLLTQRAAAAKAPVEAVAK